jgi:hypothetical protein
MPDGDKKQILAKASQSQSLPRHPSTKEAKRASPPRDEKAGKMSPPLEEKPAKSESTKIESPPLSPQKDLRTIAN